MVPELIAAELQISGVYISALEQSEKLQAKQGEGKHLFRQKNFETNKREKEFLPAPK